MEVGVVGVAGAAVGVGATTFNASRGKVNVPAVSSTTFTWQMYVPGFSVSSGTSKLKPTAPRSGSFSASAATSGERDMRRRLSLFYHRRQRRAAADIVRAVYRVD